MLSVDGVGVKRHQLVARLYYVLIGDLSIEALPSASPPTDGCAGAAAQTGPRGTSLSFKPSSADIPLSPNPAHL